MRTGTIEMSTFPTSLWPVEPLFMIVLIVGHEASMPLDVMMGSPPTETGHYKCPTEYFQCISKTFARAFQFAQGQSGKSIVQQKRIMMPVSGQGVTLPVNLYGDDTFPMQRGSWGRVGLAHIR